MTIKDQLAQIITDSGISNFGFVRLEKSISAHLFDRWIEKGYHGEMDYLKTSIERRRSPQDVWPQMRSAIVVAIDYVPHPHPTNGPLISEGLALYARGLDYHHFIKQRLEALVKDLKDQFPSESIVFTDSAPILEREWAVKAGLGWIGKNSCLIHKKTGSFFFIAEILLSIDLEGNSKDVEGEPLVNSPVDHCGKCRRCIDYCPTSAIQEDRTINSNLCISYLTIEAKSVEHSPIREKMSSYLFGCDICQLVCPWNIKFVSDGLQSESRLQAFLNRDQATNDHSDKSKLFTLTSHEALKKLKADVLYILDSSSNKLQKDLFATAVSRAAGNKLKRNAIYIVAEQKWLDLLPQVEKYREHKFLGELAEWCIAKCTDSGVKKLS